MGHGCELYFGNNILAESKESGQDGEGDGEPFSLSLYADGEIHRLSLRPEVKLVAVLTAFCDETNTHAGAELTCVGGYIFDEDGQNRFTEKWADVLKPLRSRGIRYFHASACHAVEDEFKNLRFAERRALFGDLIALIRNTAKFGMAIGIHEKTFKQVIERNKFQAYTGTKYTACALKALDSLGRWANEENFHGKISYRFESGNEHQNEADFMMRQIEASPEMSEAFRYGGHAFEPKYSLLPLQAADLWVWLWQRICTQEQAVPDPYWENLRRKPGTVPHYVHHMGNVSFNLLAMMNMMYEVKSNRKYESQLGENKKY